jgi:hypothetical protein
MTAAAKHRKELASAGRQEKPDSDRRAVYASELPKFTMEAIKRVRMDSRHDHLNALLDP